MNSKLAFIYLGPTSTGVDPSAIEQAKLIVLPPVKRGDIDQLVAENLDPGTIVIVDGTYFSFPAVGHVELRKAIALGWDVWGLCSMGAIRAYEMRDMGMKGYGCIYREFFKHYDFQDDEVALIHGTEAPYLALSEPMIHFRGALDELVGQGQLSTEQNLSIVADLKAMWFGNRTLLKFTKILQTHHLPMTLPQTQILVEKHRVKKQDLLAFLNEKPWTKNI